MIVLVAVVVGAVLGLTGAGGGILAVPLLAVLAGLETAVAIDASLIGVGTMAAAGSALAIAGRRVSLRRAVPVALLALAATPVGTWIGASLPPGMLTIAFVVVALAAAVLMYRGSCGFVDDPDPADAEDVATTANPVAVPAAGVGTGLLAGALGLGGGFVLVPALVAAGVPIRRAAGVALVAVGFASGGAVLSRVAAGRELPWGEGLILGAVGPVAWFVADRLAGRLRACRLKEIFAGVVAVALLAMLLQQLKGVPR